MLAVSFVADDRGFYSSDTTQVLAGVRSLDDCLHHHVWSHCESPGHPVGPFPPAQYLVGLAAKRIGLSFLTTLNLLIDINALAWVGALGLLLLTARRLLSARLATILVIVGLTGPLAWYAESGYGESLATFLTLAAVAGVALRAPSAAVIVAVFLAGLTKEPASIFIVPVIGAILLARGERLAALLPTVSAAFAAALADGAFNLWRYGTFYNEYYSEPARVTPGVGLKAQFFAGQLIAPNAGILWLWFAAFLLLVVAITLGLRERSTRPASLMVLGTTVGLLAIFAAYHSPYGWSAFGPRYLIPWMPALCLAAVLIAHERLEAALDWLGTHTLSAVATTVVLVLLALPQMGFYLAPLRAYKLFYVDRPPCVFPAGNSLEAYEQPNFYDCITHTAWAERPVLLYGWRPLRTPLGLTIATLMTVGVASGAAAARTRRPALR